MAQTGTTAIAVDVRSTIDTKLLGFQYLLVAIPFGRVTAPHLAGLTAAASFSALALKGYRPVQSPELSEVPPPRLKIRITSAHASAYDLLFLRRISASIELIVTLEKNGVEVASYSAYGSCGEFRTMGFEPQLRYCLEKAVHGAINDGLLALGL